MCGVIRLFVEGATAPPLLALVNGPAPLCAPIHPLDASVRLLRARVALAGLNDDLNWGGTFLLLLLLLLLGAFVSVSFDLRIRLVGRLRDFSDSLLLMLLRVVAIKGLPEGFLAFCFQNESVQLLFLIRGIELTPVFALLQTNFIFNLEKILKGISLVIKLLVLFLALAIIQRKAL